MGSFVLRELPGWWREMPFDDPLYAWVQQGQAVAVLGNSTIRDAAACAEFDLATLAVHVDLGQAVTFAVRAREGALWRVQCEHASGQVWMRAEPIAASVRRAEQLLRSQLADRVVDGMEHELRSALNAISLNAQLIVHRTATRKVVTGAELERPLGIIQSRLIELTQRQHALIDDWLRLEDVDSMVDPVQMLKEAGKASRACLAAIPVELDVKVSEQMRCIGLSRKRLMLILLAGIITVADATGAGSALQLATGDDEAVLRIELTIRPALSRGTQTGGTARSLLPAAGALTWSLGLGRDELVSLADGGWRLNLARERSPEESS